MDVQNASNLQIPQGEVKTIHDSTGNLLWGRLSYDVKYSGDTLQNGTPSPDNPITVQIVTGTQLISVTDEKNSEDYNISLGSIELCKLGDYQDYIYKSGTNWYEHKEIGKITLDGTENGWAWNANDVFTINLGELFPIGNATIPYVNYFIGQTTTGFSQVLDKHLSLNTGSTAGSQRFIIKYTDLEHNAQAIRTWLGLHNTIVYYPLITPTDTQITDNTLINQLNGVDKWLTRVGYNSTISGNLPIILVKTNL